jgi:hypothetical protein
MRLMKLGLPYQTTEKQQQAMGIDTDAQRDKSPYYIDQQTNMSSAGPLQRTIVNENKVIGNSYHR